MGADMFGYFVYYPVKTAGKLMRKQLGAVDKVLNSKAITEDKITALRKLNVSFYDMEELGIDKVDYLEDIALILEEVKTIKDISFRDMVSRDMNVNGVAVSVLFAGDMSWGDEPDGGGYAFLKGLVTLGVSDVFDKAIPWNNKAKKK